MKTHPDPTPDHNVTRDNQQTAYPCTFPACGSPGEYCRPTCGSSAISAPAQPSGDGQRTPRTDSETFRASTFNKVVGEEEQNVVSCSFARELERENNALRARVAELERPCGWPNCDPAKTCIEKLQAAVRNSDQNLEALLDLRAQLQSANERADALRRECEQAQEKQKELNRRCQHAESVIAKSGIVEGREQGPKNRSFGRALANYAAAQAYRERDEARDELAQWRDCAGKLAEAAEHYLNMGDYLSGDIDPVGIEGDNMVSDGIEHRLKQALASYRALQAPTAKSEGGGR